MKSSIILPVAVLGTLCQAVWPSPFSGSNLTMHNISSHAPLEIISLPNGASGQLLSSHQSVALHNLPSLPTKHSFSSRTSGVPISPSTVQIARTSSSHRGVVHHTLPIPAIMNGSSFPISDVVYSHSNLSPAHNSSSGPNAAVTPVSSPSSSPKSLSRPLQMNVSAIDIDHKVVKTLTLTKYKVKKVTATQPNSCISTVTVIKTHLSCKHPNPTTWDPPRSPVRQTPAISVDTRTEPRRTTGDPPHNSHGTVRSYSSDNQKHQAATSSWGFGTVRPHSSESKKKPEAVPTPWDPPPESHGTVQPYTSESNKHEGDPTPLPGPHGSDWTVRPYTPDQPKKYKAPTYTITVFDPETTCPPGFTCQPDDDYVENKLANREAKAHWPAPPGCVNRCVGGQGCWTECDKPTKQPRVCPEGYSCRIKKLLASAPNPEPPEHEPPRTRQPATVQQPGPPAAYSVPPWVPNPLPPSAPYTTPVIQAPPALPPPVALPLPVSHSVAQPAPVAPPPVDLPPPAASAYPIAGPPAAPASPSVHVDTSTAAIPTPSHRCPHGKHPCPHSRANETSWAPDTITKAEGRISVPVLRTARMYMLFAPFIGLVMA
jgi:hypothetical protein